MIIEDEKLFAPKEAHDMDPLSRIDYIKKRREELLKKIDSNSKKDFDKLKSEVSKQFEEYQNGYIEDFQQEARKTSYNFTEKLNFNLNSFEKDLKSTLENINKPIDLLDGDNDKAIQFKEIRQLFDYKEYVRNEMEIRNNGESKDDKTSSTNTIETFINDNNDSLIVLEKPNLIKKGCAYKFQNMIKKVMNSNFFLQIKERILKKKFLLK